MTEAQKSTLELITALREMGAVKVCCGDISVEWNATPKREEEPVLRRGSPAASRYATVETSSEAQRIIDQFREVLT